MTETSGTYNHKSKKTSKRKKEDRLEALLAKQKISVNELAGAVSVLSGSKINPNAFYRHLRDGGNLTTMPFSPYQWIAIAEVIRISDQELAQLWESSFVEEPELPDVRLSISELLTIGKIFGVSSQKIVEVFRQQADNRKRRSE